MRADIANPNVSPEEVIEQVVKHNKKIGIEYENLLISYSFYRDLELSLNSKAIYSDYTLSHLKASRGLRLDVKSDENTSIHIRIFPIDMEHPIIISMDNSILAQALESNFKGIK